MRLARRHVGALNVGALLFSLASSALVARSETSPLAIEASERSAAPLTVVDATGAAVAVRPYRRILAGSHVADHLVAVLCERERILAVSGNGLPSPSDPARFAGIPVFERIRDVESVIDLGPDLVLVNNFVDAGAVAQLRQAGLEVFDLGEMKGVDSFLEDARAVAAVIGEPERGERFAASFEQRMRAIAADVPASERPRAMYLGTHGTLFFGGARETSYHDVLVYGGLEDAAAHYEGWPSYTSEQILEIDPEILLTSTGKGAVICRRPGLDGLRPCHGEGRIIELPWELLVDPGAAMLDAAEAVRREVHGALPAPEAER